MSLIKWKESNLFPAFNSLWDNFFQKGLELGTSIPAMNTSETEKEYQVEIAVPGLKKDDFKINLEHNILSISSETKTETEEKDGEKVTKREFNYSSFQRSFSLPENVDKDQISAEYINGILKLHIPKTSPTQVEKKKQIEIK